MNLLQIFALPTFVGSQNFIRELKIHGWCRFFPATWPILGNFHHLAQLLQTTPMSASTDTEPKVLLSTENFHAVFSYRTNQMETSQKTKENSLLVHYEEFLDYIV